LGVTASSSDDDSINATAAMSAWEAGALCDPRSAVSCSPSELSDELSSSPEESDPKLTATAAVAAGEPLELLSLLESSLDENITLAFAKPVEFCSVSATPSPVCRVDLTVAGTLESLDPSDEEELALDISLRFSSFGSTHPFSFVKFTASYRYFLSVSLISRLCTPLRTTAVHIPGTHRTLLHSKAGKEKLPQTPISRQARTMFENTQPSLHGWDQIQTTLGVIEHDAVVTIRERAQFNG
jgi:hypothetical protein